MMRRGLVSAALAFAGLVVACDDEAVGPEQFGRIELVIVSETAPPATTPALKSDGRTGGQADATIRDAARDSRIERVPDGDGPPAASGESARLSAGPPPRPSLSVAAQDRVEAVVTGPTNKTVNLTLNTGNNRWEGSIDGLTPGDYTVELRGYVNNEVDSYGRTTGVQVHAGANTTATISFPSFQPVVDSIPTPTAQLRQIVTWSGVGAANGYDVQVSDNPSFSPAVITSVTATNTEVGPAPGVGTYYVRVRAKNASVVAGRWSAPRNVEVVADTIGDDAAGATVLGFGTAINVRRPAVNVLPVADEDWYRFSACRGDTIRAETYAQRLTPVSDLNTALRLLSGDGTTEIAANDDAVGTDSRIEAALGASGDHFVVVRATSGIGAYELELELKPGALSSDTATACRIEFPKYIEVTPRGQTLLLGGMVTFTAAAFDTLDNPISGAPFTWSSLNPEIVAIDAASGLATPVASGQATVAAEYGGVQGFALVTVGLPVGAQANLFTSQATPSDGFEVWGFTTDNIWAVGDTGAIRHWDGTAWSPQTSGVAATIKAVWGASEGEVFAAGYSGTILVTYDSGASWTPMTSNTGEDLWGLWGSAPDDVFAVGTGGAILHYDGDAWSVMTSNTTEWLRAVWGTAGNNVYAVGANSALMHYDGTSWSAFSPALSGDFRDIWGLGPNDFWVVGGSGLLAHYDGGWTTPASPTASVLWGVSGTTSDDIYAVGGNALVLRFNGVSWDSIATPAPDFLMSVWAAPSGDVFVGGGDLLRGYRGGQLLVTGAPSSVDPLTPFTIEVTVADAGGVAIPEATGNIALTQTSNPGALVFRAHNDYNAVYGYVDPVTPAVRAPLGGTSTTQRSPTALVYDPLTDRVLLSGWGDSLHAIDPLSGNASLIAAGVPRMRGMAWVGGVLWGASASTNEILEVDPTTGGYTSLGPVTGVTVANFNGLATDPTTGVVYAVANPSGSGEQVRQLITVDPSTLGGTPIGTLSEPGVSSLAFLPDGRLLAGTGVGPGVPYPGALFEVSKTTAAMTGITGMGVQDGRSGEAITAVPARMTGTFMRPLVGGVASFNDLTLDAPAQDYRLRFAGVGVSADLLLDVSPGVRTSVPVAIVLEPTALTVHGLGDTVRVTAALVEFVDGALVPIAGEPIGAWNTSDGGIASIDGAGLITGVAAGAVLVSATDTSGFLNSGYVDVTVDPTFTGTISAATAGFADQLTLTPGAGVTWTGSETVTVGGELPYIESQDASQIVLRVPSVPIGDAEVVIGNQAAVGFTQYDTIAVTSVYTRAIDPGGNPGDAPRILNDTTFYISTADSMESAAFPPWHYHTVTLSPSQDVGYTVTLDWQTGATMAGGPTDSGFAAWVHGGPDLIPDGQPVQFGVLADTTWRLELHQTSSGQPQTMARVTVTITPATSFGTSVVAGTDHSCMLDLSGNAYCWGSNSSGQLGDGSAERYSTSPVAVTGGLTFTALTAGQSHACGLTASGEAYCWGADFQGQIGDGAAPMLPIEAPIARPPGVAPPPSTEPDPGVPAQILRSSAGPAATADVMPTPVAGGHVFMQLDAGAIHTCGVTTAGDVYCWGYNYYGQLGTGSNVSSTTPVQIASPAGVTFSQVAAGDLHTCAVATTGDVYCWGYNYYGQVGDGTQTDNYNPTNVATGMVSVTAAALHTCALNALGDVWCWGYGGAGQFGNGTYVTINVSPVAGASGYGFTRLFAGVNTYSTCGVTAANAAYCWGDNARGQLGDGTTDGTATPAAVVGGIPFVAMDITGNHTCGASIYGRAYCWGSWDWGETGQGGSLPITPQTVSGGSGFTAVSVGRYHSCALSGTAAYCWGYNGQGQLGNGGGVEMAAPAAVSGGYAFQSLSTGEYHSCGVTTTGVGYCWGNNYYGSLGDGTTAYAQLSPVAVAGGLLFSQIDAGRGFTTCGLTDVGAAYCWGQNDQGQLGTGVVGDSAIAPDSVHTPLTFGQIATGQGHACALTTTAGGDIWCWGANDYGQLGDGTQTDNPTPVQVDNLGGSLSFTSVRAGGLHTCATTSANETYCWGYGYTGALGDGMGNISAVPVLVSGGYAFTDLGLGRYSSCGAEAGGGYCWGDNGTGQLGTGTLDYEYTPAAIAGGLAFTRVTGGWYHGCGTTTTESYCWGQNDYGQLGTGAFNRYLTPHLVVGGIVAQSPPAFTLPSVTGSSVRRSLRP